MEQTIGAKIREFRKARGMTQKELGEKSGIAEATIRRYELGKLNPKFETVKKIATALNVPAAIFFEPSPKEQAWNLFNAIPSDEKKKAAVQIAIKDILNEYGKAPLPAFNRIMKSYGKNEPLTYKLVEDLEALIYDPSTDLDKK